jgi:Tfp pilus assembly protein PilF
MDWVAEERFSSRAYMVAAAFASILEDFTQADKLARDGLRYNPKSVPLNNSLVFSLARQGKLDAAEAELQKMSDVDDPQGKLVAEANRGLIAMRRGNLDLGETLYRRVISRFRQEKMFEAVATAHAYFAYEAIIAKHPLTFEILKEAKHWAAEFNAPIARHVIGSADKILNHYNLSGDFTSAA